MKKENSGHKLCRKINTIYHLTYFNNTEVKQAQFQKQF